MLSCSSVPFSPSSTAKIFTYPGLVLSTMQQQDAPVAFSPIEAVLEFIESTNDILNDLGSGYIPQPSLADLKIQCCGELDFYTGESCNGGDKFINPLDREKLDSLSMPHWNGEWPMSKRGTSSQGAIWDSQAIWGKVEYYMNNNREERLKEECLSYDQHCMGWKRVL